MYDDRLLRVIKCQPDDFQNSILLVTMSEKANASPARTKKDMNSQLSHFSTLGNDHILIWFISCSASVFYHVYNIQSLNDLSKYDMLIVQEWCRGSCDEELTSIGVWS